MLKLKLLVVLVVVFGIGACDDDPVKKSTLWCDGQCANGVCTPEGDGARCVCETGYTGLLCDECASGYERDANNVCVPVANDPCLQQPCLFGGECEAVDEDNFICHCAEGYTGETCQQCAEGFVRSLEGTCVPEQIEDPCDPNPCFTGECIADGENFTCNCTEEGYTGEFCQFCAEGYVRLDDMSCVPNPCLNEHCSGHGVCQLNTATAEATCDCFEGYASVGLSCVDINECTANPCSPHATCENTDGGFVCECNVGYEGDGFVLCVDINECTANPCSSHATCENTDGGFVCECNVGYEGDGFVLCVDINECTANPCSSHATCENTDGGFVCTCNAGYEGNGLSCVDINECALNTDNCDVNATCTNTVGSFTCACNAGFSGNGVVCTDINECALNTDNCDVNATCTNTVGSFTCACNAGFSGNGVVCTDINECASNPCPTNATCANLPGSYTCTCFVGYTGSNCDVCDTANGYTWDGSACTLDPCFSEDCSGHGTCSVQGGLPVCTCETGYTGTDCADCASNYRLMGGFCQPMFGRLAGGAIFSFAEANGDLYGFGQNEVVVKYDEVEDTWTEVWRPDISWSSNDAAEGIRNDFMAAASDGQTVYLLQHYFAKQEWTNITGSNRNIVRTFTPGAVNPWGYLPDLPPTGTQIAPVRCNDLGIGTFGELLWVVCDDGTVYQYNFVANAWSGELVHDNTTLALNKIWVENSDSIFVVGDAGFLKHWNGASWEDWRNATLDTDLYGVWGYSSSDLYVGGRGKLWHWNGSSWTLKSQANTPYREYRYVRKIHGNEDGSLIVALATGDWNDYAFYNSDIMKSVNFGASFTVQSATGSTFGNALYPWSVFCQGISCLIGGSGGVIDMPTKMLRLTAGGYEWLMDMPYEPRGVSGYDEQNLLFACGNAAVHFDGSRYTFLPVASVGELGNMSFMATFADGVGGYWLVGPKGYVLYWDGIDYDVSSLSKHLIDTGDYSLSADLIYTVHGSSPTNVWAAGSRGATFRWDGSSWTRFNLPHTGARVTGILAVSPTEVYATGRDWSINDYVHVYKWDGAIWTVAYTYAQYDHSTYNLMKDGVHICTPFGDGSRAYVVCSADGGNTWSTFITTSAGNTSGKIFGSKNNLFFLSHQGRILNYRAGVETRIHRETSNNNDDDAFPTLVDVWQDPASDYTVIIGAASKVLVHR